MYLRSAWGRLFNFYTSPLGTPNGEVAPGVVSADNVGKQPFYTFFRQKAFAPSIEANFNLKKEFFGILPVTHRDIEIHRINITLRYSGSADAKTFGNTYLSRGIIVGIWDDHDTLIVDYTDGSPIMGNADLTWLSGSKVTITSFGGADYVSASIDFLEAGLPVVLRGDREDRFGFFLDDDYGDLDSFRVLAHGMVKDV